MRNGFSLHVRLIATQTTELFSFLSDLQHRFASGMSRRNWEEKKT